MIVRLVILAFIMLSCNYHVISNNKRVVVFSSNTDSVCIEPVGPMSVSKAVVLSGSYKDIKSSLEINPEVAKIYQVEDIMQFGHSMLFAVCMAKLNGSITNEEYLEAVFKVSDKIESLIHLSVTLRNDKSLKWLVQLLRIDAELEKIRLSETVDKEKEKELVTRKEALVTKWEQLEFDFGGSDVQ